MRKLILVSAILLVSASAQAQVSSGGSSGRGLTPLKATDNAAQLNKPVEQPKTTKSLSVAEQLQAIGEIKSDAPKGQVTYMPAKDEARPPVQADEVKPLEAPKPAEIKAVETKPAEAKPAENKQADVKPAEAKPVEAEKPAEAPAAKTADAKPVEKTVKPRAKRHLTTQATIEKRIRSELRRYGIAFNRYGVYW